MPIDPKLLKKLLIIVLIIGGLFIGYQLITETEQIEDTETEATQTEQGYANEDLSALYDKQKEDVVIDEQMGKKVQFNNSFEHTHPGVSSEIIVNASGLQPGESTIVYVKNTDTEEYIEAGGQEQIADSNGNISTRFTITQFGAYEVFLTSDGEPFTSPTIFVE